jgi:type IV secretory pathway VirB10-like protein
VTRLPAVLGIAMAASLLAGIDPIPTPRRRRSDPPPPPPPKTKTPEEATAELERHRRWCEEMDAAAERRRQEAWAAAQPNRSREAQRRAKQMARKAARDPNSVALSIGSTTQVVTFAPSMTEAEALAFVRAGNPPEFRRAGGDVTCVDCGKPYRKHPLDPNEVGFAGPFLNRLCGGELVKL